MSSPAPGWNPDPSGRHEYRYWDGSNWTDDVSDNGVTSTDPLAGAGGPGAPGGPGYPAEQAPTAPFEPTQAYGQGPGTPGYDQPGGYPPSGGYPPAGPGGYGTGGPGAPGGPGGYDPYGSGGGMPPATPQKKGTPIGLIIGLALAAVAIIVVLAVVLLGGGDDDDTATDDTTTTTEETETTTTEDEATTTTAASDDPETQDVFALGVGDCVTDSSLEGEVSEVSTIDCSQSHSSEVYHSYLMTDASLPDQTGIETVVQDQCLPAFQAFVGLAYQDSVLEVSYLAPTQDSWDAGDRELLCLIYDPSGDVTGSLAGANR
jgi:hypothetical protein